MHCGHATASVHLSLTTPYLSRVNENSRSGAWGVRCSEREITMNLIRSYQNWRRYRQTVNELSRLSNRELADLGITRADIAAVAARGRG